MPSSAACVLRSTSPRDVGTVTCVGVEKSNVVQFVPVDEDEPGCCKSACADEADVVSQTWAHHTELFG